MSSGDSPKRFAFLIADLGELTPSDLLQLLRLRFQAYSRRNLIDANAQQAMEVPPVLRRALAAEHPDLPDRLVPHDYQIDFDEYDFLPCCRHLVSKYGDVMIGGMRVIHENPDYPLPLMDLYSEEFESCRRAHRGGALEISRLIRNEAFQVDATRGPGLQYELGYKVGSKILMVTRRYAERMNIADLFIQIHPAHALPYEIAGFVRIGEERSCSRVNNAPAVLLYRKVEAD